MNERGIAELAVGAMQDRGSDQASVILECAQKVHPDERRVHHKPAGRRPPRQAVLEVQGYGRDPHQADGQAAPVQHPDRGATRKCYWAAPASTVYRLPTDKQQCAGETPQKCEQGTAHTGKCGNPSSALIRSSPASMGILIGQ